MSSAPHVYAAINAVTAELAKDGISKSRKNQQQGYSFRGIDEVFNALAPLLAANHLTVLPRALSRDVVERQTKSGNPLFYVAVDVEYDFVSAVDGSKHTVRVFGEAMDSADKATNKALSAAYKYACLQAFCIPTEGDNDADATTHAVAPALPPYFATPQERDVFRNGLTASFANAKTLVEVRDLIAANSDKLNAIKATGHADDVGMVVNVGVAADAKLKELKLAEAA